MSVNEVTLVGHLGQDPEVKTLQSGNKCANLSVATSEKWNDKQTGEKKEKTEWHRIVIWTEHSVNFAEKYLKKGDLVYIRGKLQTRKWQDQGGNDRYSTEVVVQGFRGDLQPMRTKSDRGNGDSGSQESASGVARPAAAKPVVSKPPIDDEIPF